MIQIEKLHHVAVPAHAFGAMHEFYTQMLGLDPHPEKPNWLRAGDSFSVHLMPTSTPPGPSRIEQHFALQVASLRDVVAYLLEHGFEPYQASLQGVVHRITDPADSLRFGIGTVFLTDPENNTIEFLEADSGLFEAVRHSV